MGRATYSASSLSLKWRQFECLRLEGADEGLAKAPILLASLRRRSWVRRESLQQLRAMARGMYDISEALQ
jgi:hypothetical protein